MTPTLTLNFGVRWDKPDFGTLPPENDVVFQQYGRHTSSVPSQAQISPRFGFNWDVTGDQVQPAPRRRRLVLGRGAVRVPLERLRQLGPERLLAAHVHRRRRRTRRRRRRCSCRRSTRRRSTTRRRRARRSRVRTASVVPGAAISGPAANAAINSIDPDFKYPKYLKATLGYDHRLPWGLIGTIEGLYTRSQDNAFYQNLALVGPQGVDPRPRALRHVHRDGRHAGRRRATARRSSTSRTRRATTRGTSPASSRRRSRTASRARRRTRTSRRATSCRSRAARPARTSATSAA